MPALIVVGAQWGDEGKGKVTDLVGQSVDWVVKFNGGNNAGHTIVVGDQKFGLHLIPAGILSPTVTPVIGNGVVVDLEVMFAEIKMLEEAGVDCSRLKVSLNAHIIPPYNKVMDGLAERSLGERKIGTTGRGIGPTYADKMNRIGLRIQDLFDESILRQKVRSALSGKNFVIEKQFGEEPIDPETISDQLLSYADKVRPMVFDCTTELNLALDRGETILLEGGQATMLDIDHGTYPFVTSSSCTAGGACSGSGIGPTRINRVIGIAKAYTTRVGEGPFPTELFGKEGEELRQSGGEFGVTTGRPRRTGWFDSVVARYAARVNGLTDLVITKLDVLSRYDEIPVCVAYDVDGQRFDDLPADQTAFHHAQPIYEMLPGWHENISTCKTFADLPVKAQEYIHRLEELSGCRISVVGVGPDREETIVRHQLLD